MNAAKVRKALIAAGGAALAVIVTGLQTEVPQTSGGWGALLGGAVAAAVVTGWATWRIPNAK